MPRFRNPVVSTADILDGSITTPKLADGAVTEPKVGDDAITTAKLADLAVEAAKLANSSVTAAKIANLAVGTAAIANLAVTDAKIAELSADKITAGTIDTGDITVDSAIYLDGSGIIATNATGARVALEQDTGTTGSIKFYNTGGSVIGAMSGASGNIRVVNAGNDFYFELDEINLFHTWGVPDGLGIQELTLERIGSGGWALRTLTNPASGDPILEVQSSGRAVRLRVEHDGIVAGGDSNGTGALQESAPGLTFYGDDDTGVEWVASGELGYMLNGSRRFRMTFAGNGARLYGTETNDWIEWDGVNEWFQFFGQNIEYMRLDTDGLGSALELDDKLTDVGNHETLRLNRGTGGTLREVGYYSSRVRDPDTGELLKLDIVPLDSPGARARWWRREWIDDLEPIKYRRRQGQLLKRGNRRGPGGPARPKRGARAVQDHPQIEIGFSIENLLEHTNLLTTKGSRPGDSPDEYALLAVTIDAVQDLRRRVAALEAQLAAAGA